MSYKFSISEIGLRLIKAYEGFNPDARTMRDGRKILGYGHVSQDSTSMITENDAEELLKSDLSVIEDAVNAHTHAAISQSQFDALVSLAHSIGLDAFLDSDILHDLNQGNFISAANGFDTWRIASIGGKTYVVDALVRRRTAEKALFLRPPVRTVLAPRHTLRATKDTSSLTENISPINQTDIDGNGASNIVPLYDAKVEENVSISVIDESQDAEIIHLTDRVDDNLQNTQSPIAEAAAEVSDRLDALMDDDVTLETTSEWPDSFVDTIDDEFAYDPDSLEEVDPNDYVVDTLDTEFQNIEPEDTKASLYSSADRYIQAPRTTEPQSLWAYITMIIFGLTAIGGGLWASFKGSQTFMGQWGPLIATAAVAIGVLLTIMGSYFLLKQLFGKS